LIESALAGTNVADAFKHLIEVIVLALARRILQPLVIHRETLHEVFAQAGHRPLAELRATMATHTETDRHYNGEVVMQDCARHVPPALRSNH